MRDSKGIRKTRRFINKPGEVHEYTFSCYHRLKLLDRDRTRQWFIEALELIRKRYRVLILAYVIMPEHAHILLMPLPGTDMEAVAKTLKQSVARKALAWLRRERPAFLRHLEAERSGARVRHHLWQPGGGYDRNLDNPHTIAAAIDYIHRNPIRRGLVKLAEDWRWSSARFYAGLDDVKINMDQIQL